MFELDISTNHQSSFRMSQYSMTQERATIITARYPTLSHGLLFVVVFRFVVSWFFLVVFESAEKYNDKIAAIGVHFWRVKNMLQVLIVKQKQQLLPAFIVVVSLTCVVVFGGPVVTFGLKWKIIIFLNEANWKVN